MANKETTVRRLIDDIWNAGKLDTLDQLVTSDVAHHDPVNPTRGIEPLRNVVRKYRTAFPDMHQHIDELFAGGDRVAARLTCTGTQRGPLDGLAPTGRSVKIDALLICHFTGDRVSEAYVNWDALGMMQQLGAVTLPGKTAAAGA